MFILSCWYAWRAAFASDAEAAGPNAAVSATRPLCIRSCSRSDMLLSGYRSMTGLQLPRRAVFRRQQTAEHPLRSGRRLRPQQLDQFGDVLRQRAALRRHDERHTLIDRMAGAFVVLRQQMHRLRAECPLDRVEAELRALVVLVHEHPR